MSKNSPQLARLPVRPILPTLLDGRAIEALLEERELPADVVAVARAEAGRLTRIELGSAEDMSLREHLEWLLAVPWGQYTSDQLDITSARQDLAKRLHGLDLAKDALLEMLQMRLLHGPSEPPVLTFVGAPGSGKASLAEAAARLLGRRFARLSVAGLNERDLRGRHRLADDGRPGRLLRALCTAGSFNPVILIEDIDQITPSGDVVNALVEAFDPNLNERFVDHYLGLPIDLSEVIFMAAGRKSGEILTLVYEHLDIVYLTGYNRHAKAAIAREHFIPDQLDKYDLTTAQIQLSDEALLMLIDSFAIELGVARLQRLLRRLLRMGAYHFSQQHEPLLIGSELLCQLLGPPPYKPLGLDQEDRVGSVLGLSVSSAGSEVAPYEVAFVPGLEARLITGNVGDIIRESVIVAQAWAKSFLAERYVDLTQFDNKTLHVHMRRAGDAKDGPSGGLALAVAIVSAMTGIAVRRDIAMTGEISMYGHINRIGGLPMKLLAAQRAGVRQVLIPADNAIDLNQVDSQVLSDLDVRPISHAVEALELALVGPLCPRAGQDSAPVDETQALTDR